ncbi:GDSL esterase/lipase At5g62930 [Lathyrus oleraceus]|uniref:GDSL esterase/lipase At5g62930 n=1 Tax=Pisum sativum TaxID=3888 RepID=UPI0021D09586|nr:GDSL esterase/lipase At5g62930-like [Pisum sativum]
MRENIVLFGDSITEQSFDNGWGSSLANHYSRKADVIVRGYCGYNTRWALFLLDHIFSLVRKPPVATTIFFGANDAALMGRTNERQHVPIPEYKQNLKKIVKYLKSSSPTMLIVLITPPPVCEEGRTLYRDNASDKLSERTNEVTGEYAKACVETAKEIGVPSIDLWSKMQETDGWNKKFLWDGLHLTVDGNAVVYQEVIKVFNEAGLSADNMPFDFPDYSEIDHKNPQTSFQQ